MPFIGQDGRLYGDVWELVTYPDADIAPKPLPAPVRREFQMPPPASSPIWRQFWHMTEIPPALPRVSVGVYGDPSDT